MRATHRPRRALADGTRAIQIVATPGSGNGRALDRARRLRDALRARGHRARLEVFSDLDGLRRWAALDAQSFSLLICVGGDGTQDTAALAAVRRSVPFLSVASGFGNLFARQLGQPDRVERAVDMVEHGELVHVDVGVRNGELFLCQESFGLLSQIQERVEASVRQPRARWRRWLAYYRGAVRHLLDAPLTLLRVSVDGQAVASDAVVVTVANVETYGPWLPLTPDASPIDGLLDVFVMRRASKREMLGKLLGKQLRLLGATAGAVLCRGRRISISSPHRVREEIELIPRRLPVVVSSETAAALARDLARLGGFSQPARRQVA